MTPWKHLPLLATLLFSSTHAANSGPDNLKAVYLCFDKDSVQVNDALASAAPTMKVDIYQKVLTKLKAYRVPVVTECNIYLKYRLYVQIDAFRATSGGWVYILSLDLFDRLTYPGLASIWSAGKFGTAGQEGTGLANYLTTVAGDQIDTFASDYATANP